MYQRSETIRYIEMVTAIATFITISNEQTERFIEQKDSLNEIKGSMESCGY